MSIGTLETIKNELDREFNTLNNQINKLRLEIVNNPTPDQVTELEGLKSRRQTLMNELTKIILQLAAAADGAQTGGSRKRRKSKRMRTKK